jgi:hypothetical protein
LQDQYESEPKLQSDVNLIKENPQTLRKRELETILKQKMDT